jgi:lipid A ethanolaminephosphotransferase
LSADVAPSALDDRLLDIAREELRKPGPVLIYANKNGAHFPYDLGYPANQDLFRPTMTASGSDATRYRVNSYRNVVAWSVDRFLARLFEEIDLEDTVVIYTSDHGQNFQPNRFAHCSVEDPDPREALVPLWVATRDAGLKARLAAAAQVTRGHASHFQIVPTVLQLLGYAPAEVERVYGASLFEPHTETAAFTSGDVFGLFAREVRWHPIDLTHNYLEPEATTPTAAR